jgi:hypothetical protein
MRSCLVEVLQSLHLHILVPSFSDLVKRIRASRSILRKQSVLLLLYQLFLQLDHIRFRFLCQYHFNMIFIHLANRLQSCAEDHSALEYFVSPNNIHDTLKIDHQISRLLERQSIRRYYCLSADKSSKSQTKSDVCYGKVRKRGL